ncbi:MAG: gfo/Idh/MocA family oxidoreductase, partial [Kiritimatiellae bacterium]|nr:gfo/Idh/MocA family oxidoreductase [Kiritimatiellia bacterium]
MQITRKNFFIGSVAATAAIGLKAAEQKPLSKIQGFDEVFTDEKVGGPWQPFSDKKVRVGIAG